MLADLMLIFTLIMLVLFWWDTMRSTELARQAGKAACSRAQTQFLDDSVERKKTWVRRGHSGKLELCRLFFFEFTLDGGQRYQGRIVMLGRQIREVEMDAYRLD